MIPGSSRLSASWQAFLRSPRLPAWLFGGLLLCSLGLFVLMLGVPRVDGQLIGSDGIHYYVYLRSLVIDGDLDFSNEYAYLMPARTWELTETGYVPNFYAPGPALLWMPFFLLAHGLAYAA